MWRSGGVDPDVTAAAVRMVGEDNLADHVDLNFGCPKLQIANGIGVKCHQALQ